MYVSNQLHFLSFPPKFFQHWALKNVHTNNGSAIWQSARPYHTCPNTHTHGSENWSKSVKKKTYFIRTEQQCSVILETIPKPSLTRSRQYNCLVSFSTACLSVNVTVNNVPSTANLPCELQPNYLSSIMNMECSNYSEMQACPQSRLWQKPSVKTNMKRTLQWKSPSSQKTAHWYAVQILMLSLQLNGSTVSPASQNTQVLTKLHSTMTAQLFWCTTHAQDADENKRVTRQATSLFSFSVLFLSDSSHVGFRASTGLSMLEFIFLFFHLGSLANKEGFVLLSCKYKFGH